MNTQTQTDAEQVTALALQYTMQDFKRSLIVASALANLALFVTWLTLSLA